MKKRLLSGLLALCMVLCLTPTASAKSYSTRSTITQDMKQYYQSWNKDDQCSTLHGRSQCAAFVEYMFCKLYGHGCGEADSNNKVLRKTFSSLSELTRYIQDNARAGDAIRVTSSINSNNTHIFLLGADPGAANLERYESNYGQNYNKARQKTITYSTMLSDDLSFSVNKDKISTSVIVTIIQSKCNTIGQCDHQYNSTGYCPKCKEQYPLDITSLNTTLNVTAVNGSSKTAPAHTAPYGDASIGPRLQVGSPVKVTGMAVNAFGNTWYRVQINNQEYWIVNSYLSVPVLIQNVEQSKISKNSAYLRASMTIPSGVRVKSCGIAVDTTPNPVKDSGVFRDADSKLNYTNSTKYMWYTATGLTAGTTYHYRFYIETSDGRISYGPDGSFTTTGASCTHSYNSEGLCSRCGKAEFPLTITNLDTLMTVSRTNSVSLSAPAHTAPYGDAPIPARFYLEDAVTVTGQAKNHYGNLWYRVQVGDNTYWIVSDYLTSTSVSKYITPPSASPAPTPKPTKPPVQSTSSATVTAAGASQITASSVHLDGACSYSGTRPSSVGVYLGTSSGSMTGRDSDTIKHNKNPFDIWYDLTGLSAGTTYYYQFYAIVDGREYVSAVNSFTTASPAQPTPTPKPAATPAPTPRPVPTPTPAPTPAPAATATGYVVGAGWLAINDKAAASPQYSNEIGAIPDGAAVTVYTDQTSGNWYYVTYNGVTGYAYKSYITFNTRTGTVTGTNSLAINNKAAASPKYSTEIGAIPGGAAVRIYPDKTSGNWYYVTYNGVTGYAYKSYIK